MNHSLSVLLPVYNSEESLHALVPSLMELLPELTPNFELLILDGGSSDDTGEWAREISLRYPQVSSLRHNKRDSAFDSFLLGVTQSQGDIIMWRDHDSLLTAGDISKIWREIDRYDVILARAESNAQGLHNTLERIKCLAQGKEPPADLPRQNAGYRLYHRSALEKLLLPLAERRELWEEGMLWGMKMLEMSIPLAETPKPQLVLGGRQIIARVPMHGERVLPASQRTHSHAAATHAPSAQSMKRPSFLSKIRDFSLGE